MNTDGREDPSGILGAQLQHFFTGLQTYTRLNEIVDVGFLHLLHQLRQFALFEGVSVIVICQVAKRFLVGTIVVMCVGIDKYGYPSFHIHMIRASLMHVNGSA